MLNRKHLLFWLYYFATCVTYSKLIDKRQVGSDQTCACKDWYGFCKPLNAKWTDDGSWKYECTADGLKFDGCITTDRSNRNHIGVGANQTINGFWYSCKEDSEILRYKQEPMCVTDGQPSLHVGQSYRNGRFRFRCEDWGIAVVGCYVDDAELGLIELTIGEGIQLACYRHQCSQASDSPWKVQYVAKPLTTCQGRQNVTIGTIPNFANSKTAGKQQPLPLLMNIESFIMMQQVNERIRYKNPG